MNTARRRLLLSFPFLGLAGCAGLGLPSQLTLTQAELDERLARRFPRTQRVLEVLELTLSAPRVALLPQSNRLACDFALGLRDRLFDSQYAGRIGFDTGLRWEPSDATLRLSQVTVQRLELDTAPRALSAQGQRLGRLLAEQLLEGFTLWQMPEEQHRRLQRAGLTVGPIEVTEQGLVARFTPLAPR
ncbi:hypothetical protein [Azohydromonas caseinilytica]|uniref:DUF1439 domain-containing protein n=1 Tax=Azohydromonas caseinilytica TaxID=2728836 RepID=A0A848F518_9BURK|nr:hypothetical protein [Azohydromonas caseinilytica]NML14198.1 hypothetical protein [Azohydromonas caseinilytica]